MTTTAIPSRSPRPPASAGGRSPALADLDYCVVDLETTGGSPGRSGITEIGAVRMRGLRPVARFATLVDPGRPIPPVVRELTGIDDALVAGAPRIDEALALFAEFAGDDVLVAHNAPFDLRFLNYERHRLDGGVFTQPWLDTLTLARRLLQGAGQRHDLTSLARWARTTVRPGHRALPDAEATAELLVRLLELACVRGIRTLGDLHELLGPPEAAYSHRTVLAEDLPAEMGVFVLRDVDGTPLHVGAAANLRRDVRRLLTPNGRRAKALRAAADATASVEHEVHGSRLGSALRADELTRRFGLRAERAGAEAHLIAVVDAGRGAPVRLVGSPPADASAVFGPVRGERRAREAARCLRELFPWRPDDTASHRAHLRGELLALLEGDARALGRLPGRVQRARAAGALDPAGARGRARVDALMAVLADLQAVRRLRERRLVLLEEGPAPGLAEAFFIAGGAVVARRVLSPDDWREGAEDGLRLVRSARVVDGPMPWRLHAGARLLDERLSQRAMHPAVVRLQSPWDLPEAVEAVGRAAAAAARTDADPDIARRLDG